MIVVSATSEKKCISCKLQLFRPNAENYFLCTYYNIWQRAKQDLT
jgi:hypothetical protein